MKITDAIGNDFSLSSAVEQMVTAILTMNRSQNNQEHDLIAEIGTVGLQPLKVIEIIGYYGKCSMSNIAQLTYNSLSCTTAIVNKLVKNGLVERLRDEKDRRVVFATLSKKGLNLYNTKIDFLRAFSRRILESLEGTEQKLLLKILNSITQGYTEMDPVPSFEKP